MMSYQKNDLNNHIAKMKALFARELPDRILIHFVNPPPNNTMPYFPDYFAMFKAEMENVKARARLKDDFYPSANPSFGNAFCGYLGGELHHSQNNIWGVPFPDLYERLDTITYDEKHHWLNELLKAVQIYKVNMPPNCALSCPSTWGPMDIAESLRGGELYYDFYDRPAQLIALAEHCSAFVFQFRRRLLSLVDALDNGHICWQGFWTPHTCYALTDDAATNYSPEMFEQVSRPVINSLVKQIGGLCWIHLEGSAYHIIDHVKSIPGLILLQYTNNPKWPRGIAMLDALRSKLGDLPLKILVSQNELREGMRQHILPGNCIFDVGYDTEATDGFVKTPEEAREIMRLAGEYRAH